MMEEDILAFFSSNKPKTFVVHQFFDRTKRHRQPLLNSNNHERMRNSPCSQFHDHCCVSRLLSPDLTKVDINREKQKQ